MGESKYKFQKLTPVSDIDLKVYEDAINYIFDNNDIRNVAISGAYSAGKSSVLASYKKKHSDLKFVHISLAHFISPEQDDKTKVKESIIEGKILNQLIHQIPSNKIPQTNFKVKKKIEPKNIVLIIILIMLFVLSALHITYFDSWRIFVSSLTPKIIQHILIFFTRKYSLLISGQLCFTILSYFVYALVKIQKNKNIFRKISFKGNEIEIFEESNESYFDKYLNEVLYLFENVEADVIVFEDMDRFDANIIFERLREVNNLANIQLENENKPSLRFFYLLRDDIFISKDRTKFFDYIVPVVPVVDSSNSYDQFISHFKEGGIFQLFDEGFLQGLSLYIDDMRLLKNIYNEFVIYYNRLNTIELDCNKMLALIAYKNIFPRDFNDLQLNQGMVFTLFDKKDNFIKTEIERLKDLKIQKEDEIKYTRKEHLNTVQELEDVLKAKLSLVPTYMRQRQDVEKKNNEEYSIRKKAIENKVNDLISDLKEELSDIEQKIVLTQNKQLKGIISRENINTIFTVKTKNEIGVETDFNEIKGSEYFALLKYLIRNGFIDETYADYMTYFYENSLSRVDKTFLRSITDKKAKEYTYQLKNPQLVTDKLQIVDFDQEEILNFDLLQYLLQTPKQASFLNKLLCMLKETKNFKFIGGYFNAEREISTFVNNLNLQWPEFFSCAIEGSTLTEKQIRLYSIYTLYYSEDDCIQVINKNDCLTDYISNSSNYLEISEPNIDVLLHGLILLKVSFISIYYDNVNKALFDVIYQNSLYKINFENLALMLRKVYKIENEDDIRHKNYTLILKQLDSPLALYVKQNINIYINVIIQNCDKTIVDDEEVTLLILNNSEISIEQKNSYIESLQTSITSIADVEDKTLWNSLLDHRLSVYSEENIIVFFKNINALNATLIGFIESNKLKLDFSEVKKGCGDNNAENLFDAIIICNELSNLKYKEMLTSLDFYYEAFNVTDISDEKIRILIDEKIVRMNAETLEFVRVNYSNQILYFIQNNINEYVNIITSKLFDFGELVKILSCNIADEIKIKMLNFTAEPLSILGKSYSTAVNEHVLKRNLATEDLPDLFAKYENWISSTQQIIFDLAIKNIAYIIASPNNVSTELLRTIIFSDALDNNVKEDLLISLIPDLNEEVCKEYLDLLGLTDYIRIFESRRRPKFEINTTNKKLLTAFKERKWIYNFQEDQTKAGYYKIIRKG